MKTSGNSMDKMRGKVHFFRFDIYLTYLNLKLKKKKSMVSTTFK